MSKLKNASIVWGSLVLLGTIGVIVNGGATTPALHAAPTPPSDVVTIGGPLPLPTTAAQNGAWNVGINGTPNVNVANTPGVNINNTPNVSIAGTPNVSIAGTPTVRNADEPGRAAFQTTVTVGFGQGLVGVPIPAGTRLVIDYVSIHGNAQGPGTVVPTILFESSINSQPSVNYYISPVQIGDATVDQWRASEQVKIYADSLAMGVGYAGVVPTTLSFDVNISGHLIAMP
jgi:hypothetical protein